MCNSWKKEKESKEAAFDQLARLNYLHIRGICREIQKPRFKGLMLPKALGSKNNILAYPYKYCIAGELPEGEHKPIHHPKQQLAASIARGIQILNKIIGANIVGKASHDGNCDLLRPAELSAFTRLFKPSFFWTR
jgi:hypothetical protein